MNSQFVLKSILKVEISFERTQDVVKSWSMVMSIKTTFVVKPDGGETPELLVFHGIILPDSIGHHILIQKDSSGRIIKIQDTDSNREYSALEN